MCNVIDFVSSENRTHICISKISVGYWGKKSKDNIAFSKSTLTTSLKHVIQNCYFMVGNWLLRQKIDIPMRIDPAPFWANFFLYTYENQYMSELISNDKVEACYFHAIFYWWSWYLKWWGYIQWCLQRHLSPWITIESWTLGTHATFLNLDITVKDGVSIYKLFDKRDVFPFFIVRMPYIDCIDRNIPK